MNFLEAVYSYVFGDGDANPYDERRQIAACAQVIRELCDVVGRSVIRSLSCSLWIDRAADVILGVEESYWLVSWDSVLASTRVEDFEGKSALLYRGTSRDDLGRLLQSGAIGQAVDDAGREGICQSFRGSYPHSRT